ncbi:MAG: hypothetical protein CBE24_00365 [bacterium TMED264]|jgi:hypothetical protein|nr:MAG: hypothetical protein CBE24_00365 [bacterium TMED264]|tara:strand:+ start:462 stop:929 length:468 start_codon:yes stop_codon:yes gene_type:complete
MPQSDIVETLEMVSKAKTREEKRQILKDRENFATKAILQLNYHPDVKWKIPKGAPPYTPNENQADASLHYEVKKLDYYVDPSPHNLPMLRREAMFVQLLERLTPKDAKLLIDMKDKKISYKGLSYKLVRDTWPDLLPEIEEEKSESKSKEAVVEE